LEWGSGEEEDEGNYRQNMAKGLVQEVWVGEQAKPAHFAVLAYYFLKARRRRLMV